MEYYIAAILFMAAMFICGYRLGNFLGWREGFRIAKALERQRIERAMKPFRVDGSTGGEWAYSPEKQRGHGFYTAAPP